MPDLMDASAFKKQLVGQHTERRGGDDLRSLIQTSMLEAASQGIRRSVVEGIRRYTLEEQVDVVAWGRECDLYVYFGEAVGRDSTERWCSVRLDPMPELLAETTETPAEAKT